MKEFKQERRPSAKERQLQKHILWENYFADYGRGISMYRTPEAVKLVLNGIPDDLRREIWLIYSGEWTNDGQDHSLIRFPFAKLK